MKQAEATPPPDLLSDCRLDGTGSVCERGLKTNSDNEADSSRNTHQKGCVHINMPRVRRKAAYNGAVASSIANGRATSIETCSWGHAIRSKVAHASFKIGRIREATVSHTLR